MLRGRGPHVQQGAPSAPRCLREGLSKKPLGVPQSLEGGAASSTFSVRFISPLAIPWLNILPAVQPPPRGWRAMLLQAREGMDGNGIYCSLPASHSGVGSASNKGCITLSSPQHCAELIPTTALH